MNELLQFIWKASGFKGSCDPTTGVKIDDRNEHDVFPEFCTITAFPEQQPDAFVLELYPMPLDQELADYSEGLVLEQATRELGHRVAIRFENDDIALVKELAKKVRRIIARGKSYPNRQCRWICPRTANSLERLARMMREFQRAKRNGQLDSTEEDEGLFALSDE